MGMVKLTHPDYDWYQIFTNPSDAGHFAMARSRTYCIGRHKTRSCCIHDPFLLHERLKDMMHQLVTTRPSDYLIASKGEVLMEAEACARRRQVEFKPDCLNLWYLLLPREQETVRGLNALYLKRHGKRASEDPDLCYFLGDSLAYRTWSATSRKVPTFRMNSKTGKFWFPMFDRWATARERLSLMGFPVVPHMAAPMMVGVYPAADVRRASDVCGNSMQFNNAAMMQLIALSCFGPVPS